MSRPVAHLFLMLAAALVAWPHLADAGRIGGAPGKVRDAQLVETYCQQGGTNCPGPHTATPTPTTTAPTPSPTPTVTPTIAPEVCATSTAPYYLPGGMIKAHPVGCLSPVALPTPVPVITPGSTAPYPVTTATASKGDASTGWAPLNHRHEWPGFAASRQGSPAGTGVGYKLDVTSDFDFSCAAGVCSLAPGVNFMMAGQAILSSQLSRLAGDNQERTFGSTDQTGAQWDATLKQLRVRVGGPTPAATSTAIFRIDIQPTPAPNQQLFAIDAGGVRKFRVDAEGDVDTPGDLRAANADVAGVLTQGTLPLVRVVYKQTADVTVANTTTETSLLTSAPTLPALAVGSTIRVQILGAMGTMAATPGNGTLRVRLGGTTILSRAGGLGNGAVVGFMEARFTITARTVSATGTTQGHGQFRYDVGAFQTGPVEWGLGTTAQPVTVDNTGAKTLNVSWEFATANVLNTITASVVTVEVIP